MTYEPGTTVLPSLIDTHSHLCGNSEFGALDRLPGLSPGGLDQAIEAALTAQLAAGVTAVRTSATSSGRLSTGIGTGPAGRQSSPPAHPSPARAGTARS